MARLLGRHSFADKLLFSSILDEFPARAYARIATDFSTSAPQFAEDKPKHHDRENGAAPCQNVRIPEEHAFKPEMLPGFQEIAREHGLKTYKDVYRFSLEHNDLFWEHCAKMLSWREPFHTVQDCDLKKGKVGWFLGGKLNVSENCLDRHVAEDPNKIALLWEKDEPDEGEQISYGRLLEWTCKMANTLKQAGVQKGDCVCIYLPTSPMAVVPTFFTFKMSRAANQDIVEVPASSKDKSPALTDDQTKFVCQRRLEMEPKFQSVKTKSGPLWMQIWLEFKEAFPTATHDCTSITKRFHNMMGKYKTEFAIHGKSGADPSDWKHYDIFHKHLHSRPEISLSTMSTTSAKGIDLQPLSGSDRGRRGRASSEEPETLIEAGDEADIERDIREAAGIGPSKEGKRNSASKDGRVVKKPKLEDELKGMISTYGETSKNLQAAFDLAAREQTESRLKRDEEDARRYRETVAHREEALKVGRLLAGGLEAIAKAFGPARNQ